MPGLLGVVRLPRRLRGQYRSSLICNRLHAGVSAERNSSTVKHQHGVRRSVGLGEARQRPSHSAGRLDVVGHDVGIYTEQIGLHVVANDDAGCFCGQSRVDLTCLVVCSRVLPVEETRGPIFGPLGQDAAALMQN